MVEQDEVYGVVGGHVMMIKAPELGKEEREKQNGLKAKVISVEPFCFWWSRHYRECDHI